MLAAGKRVLVLVGGVGAVAAAGGTVPEEHPGPGLGQLPTSSMVKAHICCLMHTSLTCTFIAESCGASTSGRLASARGGRWSGCRGGRRRGPGGSG